MWEKLKEKKVELMGLNSDPSRCERKVLTASPTWKSTLKQPEYLHIPFSTVSRVAISVEMHEELMIADKMTLGVRLIAKKTFEPNLSKNMHKLASAMWLTNLCFDKTGYKIVKTWALGI